MFILITLTGVKGAKLYLSSPFYSHDYFPIDRDILLLPDILINELSTKPTKNEIAKKLKPIFDVVWNACGVKRAYTFDDNGDWQPGG